MNTAPFKKNYALTNNGGAAQQSCDYSFYYYDPTNGIDGNTEGTPPWGSINDANLAHTCLAEEVSWEVVLGQRTNVHKITIYNRDDGPANARMEQVVLQLYDGGNLVASESLSELWKPVGEGGTATDDVFTIFFSNVFATKVKLYKSTLGNTKPINFRELEAWGTTFMVSHRFFFSPVNIYQLISM